MVRDLVVEVEFAKPYVRQVQFNFLAEPAFRADAIAGADDEHPDHQLGIDRRTTDVAVVGRQLCVQVGQRTPSQTLSCGAADGSRGSDLPAGTRRTDGPDRAAAAPSSPGPPLPTIDQPAESRFSASLKAFFDSISGNQNCTAVHDVEAHIGARE